MSVTPTDIAWPVVFDVSGIDGDGRRVIVTLELNANGQTKVRDVRLVVRPT